MIWKLLIGLIAYVIAWTIMVTLKNKFHWEIHKLSLPWHMVGLVITLLPLIFLPANIALWVCFLVCFVAATIAVIYTERKTTVSDKPYFKDQV